MGETGAIPIVSRDLLITCMLGALLMRRAFFLYYATANLIYEVGCAMWERYDERRVRP
jgi:hypothetical protein